MRNLNCLIAGASSGIGASIAQELSNSAKHIYILSRNTSKLEEINDKIISNGCECTIVPIDLCEPNVIENLSEEIFKKDKFLDIIISTAGQITKLSPVESIDLNELKDIIELNYISNFRIMKHFHPLLKNSKQSNLAIISSIKNEMTSQYWGIYQPIMSALNELVISFANENQGTSINANIIYPGAVNTSFRENIMPGENKKELNDPASVARAIVKFLLSNDKSGEIIKL
tara:strand:- start:1388 stop:2077 length:690 start_codon:yes stop_codon:yes gene_type:complete